MVIISTGWPLAARYHDKEVVNLVGTRLGVGCQTPHE